MPSGKYPRRAYSGSELGQIRAAAKKAVRTYNRLYNNETSLLKLAKYRGRAELAQTILSLLDKVQKP